MVRRTACLVLAFFFQLVASWPVLAQNLQIDPRNSEARIFLMSSAKPSASMNVGIARVKGMIKWNAADSGSSAIDFDVYPANQVDKNSLRDYPDKESYVVFSFSSNRIVPEAGGNFRVIGVLSVTHAVRLANYDPSKVYSAPVYSPAVVCTYEHEATFEFQTKKFVEEARGQQGSGEWVALGVFRGQDFPELLNTVAVRGWPAFVQDEQCTFTSSAGEDFSGPACTGKTVDPQLQTNVFCGLRPLAGQPLVEVACPGTHIASAGGSEPAAKTRKGGSEHNDSDEFVADEVKLELTLALGPEDFVRALF